jgi:RND superfamily putative drug exporter
MGFSEMGFFKNSGPTLAVGIVVGLLAGLTLTPALLSLLGKWAFWPSKISHRTSGRWYEFTSRFASSRPLTVILVIVVLMLPFSIYGQTCDVTYNFLDNAPDSMETIKGYRLLEKYFQVGILAPLTVVAAAHSADTLAANIVHIADSLTKVKEVADVMSMNNPAGVAGDQGRNFLAVQTQLQMALDAVLKNNVDPGLVADWRHYLDVLASRFPSIASDPALIQLQDVLKSDHLMDQQDDLTTATQALIANFDTIKDAYLMPSEGGNLFAALAPLTAQYISPDGLSFQMSVVIEGRLGESSTFDAVHGIRRVLEKYGNETGVTGSAVVTTDIRDTVNRDLLRAFGFVLIGIFLVLLTMLRSIVAPLYLICTVILSYTFTLGVSNLIFDVFFGEKLYWVVRFMMFVFLVALGIDYSIFLFGRIKEEVGYHGIHEGVHQAVANTGAIITSAGMILAGTFAGLMTSEFQMLGQIGFSVAFGVLVDTFIVRTVLDPALAALFGRWTWWPGGIPKAQRVKPVSPTPAEVSAD